MLPTTAQPSVNTQTMLSEADAFVQKWARFTDGDPRREEMLSRVAAVYAGLQPIVTGDYARTVEAVATSLKPTVAELVVVLKGLPTPGERVRAGEVVLKGVESFARATRLNLKDSASGKRLDSWDALLTFVKDFHAQYAAAENTLRHADENGFRAFRDKYDAFLAEQGIGATADKP